MAMKRKESSGKPIMKYATAVPGIKVRSPIADDVSSAQKAASTEYVLFALSCLNRALALLKWYTCNKERQKDEGEKEGSEGVVVEEGDGKGKGLNKL